MTVPRLTLYSRSGCHLCELAEQALHHLQFDFERREVAEQPAWEAQYGQDVPVLTLNDQVLLKGVINRSRLGLLKLRLLRESRCL
ncbi:glutaredoxin family protein [Deinococcus sp.]|uniref:glutaredoxin family protein n=1 Tax=Deinococcus sp. TaxID=47478 RepID=UPI0025BE22EA|nr:glutaredoxin family protein [Deinococcus sp.]